MQTKDFLNSPRNLQYKIDKQKEKIARWDELASSVSSPQYDREIVSGTRNMEAPFLKWLYKILDMEKVIEREMLELNRLKQEIKKAVSTYIEDEDTALVIIKRYVELLPFEEIAKSLCMRSSTMFRLHREGIEILSKGEPYDISRKESQDSQS